MRGLVVWLLLTATAHAASGWVVHVTDPVPNQLLPGPIYYSGSDAHDPYWDFDNAFVTAWWTVFGDWDPYTVDVYPGGDITIISEIVDVHQITQHDTYTQTDWIIRSTAYFQGRQLEPLVDLQGIGTRQVGMIHNQWGDFTEVNFVDWPVGIGLSDLEIVAFDPIPLYLHTTNHWPEPGFPEGIDIRPKGVDPATLVEASVLYFENATITFYPDNLPTIPEPSGFALALTGLAAAWGWARKRRAIESRATRPLAVVD
jgi:hypothetical protein